MSGLGPAELIGGGFAPAIGASSAVVLADNGGLRRQPLGPELERGQKFWDNFEPLAVFYDVFRDQSGKHVYLIGPMALNLEPALETMAIVSLPSGRAVKFRLHHGVQAAIVRADVYAGDTNLAITIAGQRIEVAIQPNRGDALAGDRVVFTINKDNALAWIADWARFYVAEHGATAAVIYDNGSANTALPSWRRRWRASWGSSTIWSFPGPTGSG